MDPILGRSNAAIQFLLTLIEAFVEIVEAAILTAHEPSKLYDIALSWTPLLNKQKPCFLEIFDIPLSTGKPASPFLTINNPEQSDSNRDHTIRIVPLHEERTLRVCFVENFDLQELIPAATSPWTESAPITSQWSSFSEKSHWEIDSYKLSLTSRLRGDLEDSYIDSVSIVAGTVRRTMKCMFHAVGDDRVIWYINVESMVQDLDLLFDPRHLKRYAIISPTRHYVSEYHSRHCERLRSLIEAHSNLVVQLGRTSGYRKLLLLLHSNAVVEDYSHQVYHLQSHYAAKKEGLSDPRRANLTHKMLAEITRDACFYEEVRERICNLAGAIDVLIESLKLQITDEAGLRQFQSMAVDLQSTCADLKRIMASLSATLENHLRLHELSRGYRDAQKVRLLSILASVFLPLSLATGLLSMQTRFGDLHYLLYDFFGVLVLLGSIVVVILVILRTHLWVKELLLQLDRDPMFRRYIRPAGSIGVVSIFLLAWALLLSSFLTGMIRDVGLGLKILGFGVAAAVGICGPLTLLVFLFVVSIYFKVRKIQRTERRT